MTGIARSTSAGGLISADQAAAEDDRDIRGDLLRARERPRSHLHVEARVLQELGEAGLSCGEHEYADFAASHGETLPARAWVPCVRVVFRVHGCQDTRPHRALGGGPRPDRGLRHAPSRDARDRADREVHADRLRRPPRQADALRGDGPARARGSQARGLTGRGPLGGCRGAPRRGGDRRRRLDLRRHLGGSSDRARGGADRGRLRLRSRGAALRGAGGDRARLPDARLPSCGRRRGWRTARRGRRCVRRVPPRPGPRRSSDRS